MRPSVRLPHSTGFLRESGFALVFTTLAFSFCLYRVDESGSLWPDAPRYTNAGAMMQDWVASGRLLEPLRFAKENYSHYPGFSVPYHPPGYPAATGTGVLALVGVVVVLAQRSKWQPSGLWACWLISYTIFKVTMPTTTEVRHFLTAAPALAGLTVALFVLPDRMPRWRLRGLPSPWGARWWRTSGFAPTAPRVLSVMRPWRAIWHRNREQEMCSCAAGRIRILYSVIVLPGRLAIGFFCEAIELLQFESPNTRNSPLRSSPKLRRMSSPSSSRDGLVTC
jgi:hypothetical protein